MSKYDEGFKLVVINAYLTGEGRYVFLDKFIERRNYCTSLPNPLLL